MATAVADLHTLNAARRLHSPRHHALAVPWSSVFWHVLASLGWVGMLVVLVFDLPGGWARLAAWFLLHDGVTQGLVCWLNRDLVRGRRALPVDSVVGARRYGAVGTRMLPLKALDTVQPLIGLSSWSVLLWSLARGRLSLAAVIASCVGAKAVFDLGCQAWLWRGHRRWRGDAGDGGRSRHDVGGLTLAGTLLTAVIELWTFQLLRLAGGAWGWAHFLTGRQHRGASSRGGLLTLDLTQEQT